MAENNNNTPTTPVASQPVQQEAPRSMPQPNTANAARSNDDGKRSVTVNEGLRKKILELSEKKRNGLLTIDEANELEQLKKKYDDDTQGVTQEKKDDDIKKDDGGNNKFSEEDIISYMYNKWLIAGGCWVGDKIENACGSAYYKMQRRILTNRDKKKQEKKDFLNSDANKIKQKVSSLRDGSSAEIRKRDMARIKKAQELAAAIGDGKMSGSSATDLLALAQYMGVRAEDAADNPQIKEIVQKSIIYKEKQDALYATLGLSREEVKENPSLVKKKMKELKKDDSQIETYQLAREQQKDVTDAKKELVMTGKNFYQKEARKIYFDTLVDQTAVNMAEAQILDTAARNGNELKNKDMKEVFESTVMSARQSLNQATETDRANYVNQDKDHPAREGNITDYNMLAQTASLRAKENISRSRLKNIGNHPNKSLTNLTQAIEKQKRTQEAMNEQDRRRIGRDVQIERQEEETSRRQEDETFNRRLEESSRQTRSMGEEAAVQQEEERRHSPAREYISSKMEMLQSKYEQHIKSPTAKRIEQIKRNLNKVRQEEEVRDIPLRIQYGNRGLEM